MLVVFWPILPIGREQTEERMLRARTAPFNVSRTNPDDSVACDEYRASRYELREPIKMQKDKTDSNLN